MINFIFLNIEVSLQTTSCLFVQITMEQILFDEDVGVRTVRNTVVSLFLSSQYESFIDQHIVVSIFKHMHLLEVAGC